MLDSFANKTFKKFYVILWTKFKKEQSKSSWSSWSHKLTESSEIETMLGTNFNDWEITIATDWSPFFANALAWMYTVITPCDWVRFWDQFARKRALRQKPEYLLTSSPLCQLCTFNSVFDSRFLPQLYSTLSQRMCGKGRWEHTRCQKSPDLRLQPMQFWSKKSENGKSRQHVIPARPQLIINIRAAIAHSMPRSPTTTPAVASTCASRSTTRLCTRWCEPAFPSGPLNVFDPWSKLFYKYIHVRRAWPSLGQVHSEFGSELEQPLASRLHWT